MNFKITVVIPYFFTVLIWKVFFALALRVKLYKNRIVFVSNIDHEFSFVICNLSFSWRHSFYLLQTSELVDSCMRGCRLFMIIDTIDSLVDSEDLQKSCASCTNFTFQHFGVFITKLCPFVACSESYESAEDRETACVFGCRSSRSFFSPYEKIAFKQVIKVTHYFVISFAVVWNCGTDGGRHVFVFEPLRFELLPSFLSQPLLQHGWQDEQSHAGQLVLLHRQRRWETRRHQIATRTFRAATRLKFSLST